MDRCRKSIATGAPCEHEIACDVCQYCVSHCLGHTGLLQGLANQLRCPERRRLGFGIGRVKRAPLHRPELGKAV